MLALHETMVRLQQHHLPGLKPAERRLLILWALNCPEPAMEEELSKAESSLRRDRARLSDLICVSAGIERHGQAVGLWVAFHLRCCLVETLPEAG